MIDKQVLFLSCYCQLQVDEDALAEWVSLYPFQIFQFLPFHQFVGGQVAQDEKQMEEEEAPREENIHKHEKGK